MPDARQPRGTPEEEKPWCWQSKIARRRIREAFDATNNVATALGVYDALCEIASDEQSPTIQTTHAWIQRISGVGVSTIKKHLSIFAELELLRVSTPILRAPSTYTLLSVSQQLTNVSQPSADVSQRANIEPLATSEESEKKFKKKMEKGEPPAAPLVPFSMSRSTEPVPFPYSSADDLPDAFWRWMRWQLKVSDKYLLRAFGDVMARKLKFQKDDRYRIEQWPKMLSSELIAYSKAKDTRPGARLTEAGDAASDVDYGYGFCGNEDPHGDVAWFAERGVSISDPFELVFLRSGALAAGQASALAQLN